MWLNASCSLDFSISTPTPFLLMLRPHSGISQWVAREQYLMTPSVPVMEFTDLYGNLCQRLVAPAGEFSIHTSFDVETADSFDVSPGAPFIEVQELSQYALPFLYPSRYCESDRFMDMAASLGSGVLPGYDQCVAIVDYIRNTIKYTPYDGQNIISAAEVNQKGTGVCRDMAHLGIALCRALCIPARLVVGYLETIDPMNLHAWFEAFVGGRWYAFDPIQTSPHGGRIAIAFGRDAADVAIYTQFGMPVELRNMIVDVRKMHGPPA